MSHRETLGQRVIAISTSESLDLPQLGLSEAHLRDAMAEIARHLLALGARLVYGGDLRAHGFSKLLFELVARHGREADDGGDYRPSVTDYLAWPVHICMSADELERFSADLEGSAELVCLAMDGSRLSPTERREMSQRQPTEADWAEGLTAMRSVMCREANARIVLGGRVDQYKGIMPGIAEEALLSLQAHQPLFLMGGFGGCARDIAEALGLVAPWTFSRAGWKGQKTFAAFASSDLSNGLRPRRALCSPAHRTSTRRLHSSCEGCSTSATLVPRSDT
jgi:hypothetical protein